MKKYKIIYSTILVLILIGETVAQTLLNPSAASIHNYSFEVSGQPAFIIEGGYHYRLDNVLFGKPILLHAVIGTPVFLLKDFDSFRFGIGSSAQWYNYYRFTIVGGLFTSLLTNKNVNGDLIAWNVKLNILPGFYFESWYFALDLAWQPTIITHISHSNYVKSAFTERYPGNISDKQFITGPKDGWYTTPANQLMTGLMVGYTNNYSFTTYINGGILYTPNDHNIFMFGDVGMVPYYFKLGIVYHG